MTWRTGLWNVTLAWHRLAASMLGATVAMRGLGRTTPTRDRWRARPGKVRPAGSKLARKASKGTVGIKR